jgi:hypothetical protein
MSIDLLGIATTNSVTDRPADDRTLGGVDTWYKNCSGPGQQDGTQLNAHWFNKVMAQLRRAIRGMGITEDNSDDDMLLKAIKAGGSQAIAAASALQPLFPEITTPSNGAMSVTTSTGSVVVAGGQVWVHRGLNIYASDSFDVSARTFATAPSKIYHLRWHAPGTGLATPAATYPNGRFLLRDLADAGYNPGGLSEDNAFFDTSYDDMLIGRVSTDGANAVTYQYLYNKAFLSTVVSKGTRETGATDPGGYLTPTYNWSRTPQATLRHFSMDATGGTEMATSLDISGSTRYGGTYRVWGYTGDASLFISGAFSLFVRA